MFDWIFKKKQNRQNWDEFRQEHWESRFSLFQEKRFLPEQSASYQLKWSDRSLDLSLSRSHLFAWSIDPVYKYTDFTLEADLAFGSGNGASSTGFVFRHLNDENYYYALISNQGRFRFDVVFNGNPIALIPWTGLPDDLTSPFSFMVIAHGHHFSFYLNKEWIAEAANDFLGSGRIGWAGQNYGDKDAATFKMSRIELESRPLEVEAQFQRWTQVIPANPAQRRQVASTLFSYGQFPQAMVQIGRLNAGRQPDRDDRFFLAQCEIRLENHESALAKLEALIAEFPDWEPALREKANLLYLLNRFLDLRDHIAPLLERFPEDEVLWNLFGHAWMALGNWAQAVTAYGKAAALNPAMPLFQVNWAHALEKNNQPAEAAQVYLTAGKAFFRQESLLDLEDVLARLEILEPDSSECLALKAKVYFQRGDTGRARGLFEQLLARGFEDSSVYYLLGLIVKDEGQALLAAKYLSRAAELEPDYYLYHFRLAELSRSLGLDPLPAARRAHELAPQDPWVLNLLGQVTPDSNERGFFFERAHLALPGEVLIAVNLSEHYHSQGRRDEAYKLLAAFPEAEAALNQKGNLLARDGRWTEALTQYEAALKRAPRHPDYLENAAAACMELQQYTRAEEFLLDLLDAAPGPRAYTALGNLMRLEGDFIRAELSLKSALEEEPAFVPALLELGLVYMSRAKYHQAGPLIEKLLKLDQSQPVLDLQAAYRRMAMDRLACAACGREWWVPKVIPPQAAVRLHGEPPAEAPAGRSPVTEKVYCIGCAQNHMRDNRFVCPDSGEFLKLNEDALKYLLMKAIAQAASPRPELDK